MRKLICLFLICFFSADIASSQPSLVLSPSWQRYDWEINPKATELTADELKESAVIIKDNRIIEIFFDQTGASKAPFTYYTKHLIVHLNSDNAIEDYNTVYISMTGVTSMERLQARFISKTGKITELDQKSIKDVDNYDNHGPYKIFALEGVEMGGTVEYLYTLKKPYEIFGTETYRSKYDYRQISLDIYAPKHLEYDARSYNGLPDPKDADNIEDKNQLHMEANNVAGFEDEMYSAKDASYPRVEYKLAYNNASGKHKRLYTWSDAADAYLKAIDDATPSERGLCETLYKKMDCDKYTKEAEKIQKIETYLKTHFTVRQDASGEKYERIPGILQTHLATEFGIMRLYYTIFEIAEIKREIVLTSDRFNKQFDGDFDSWTFLQHFLMYFPKTKTFIAPTEEFSRCGFATPEWISQDGLFIREVELGGSSSAIGTIKHIDVSDWTHTTYGLYANINFDLENGISNLHMKQTYVGYAASFIQPYFPFMGTEDRRDAMKDLLKNASTDAKPKNISVTGYNSDDTLFRQPFSVQADYSTNSFLEKTCDKYIFKIGEVIGAQVEMYQSTERRTDMVLQFPHSFHREIVFEIPIGYRVTNLEALKMDIFHEQDSTRTMEFVSAYKLEGRKVTVTVDESYRQTHYPKAIYEDFRKVINASADFNKIVVYFEKEVN